MGSTTIRSVARAFAVSVIAIAVGATAGCNGLVSGPGSSEGGSPGSGGGGPSSGSGPGSVGLAPGEAPVRRLTVREYENTVFDLVGIGPDVGSFPADGGGIDGFSTRADELAVTSVLAEAFFNEAENLAARAVADRLDAIVPCASDADRACAESFLATFGARAFRRPLTDEQRDRFLTFYDTQTSSGRTFLRTIELMLAAMLASPDFLYREIPLGGSGPLDSYAIASRLSYFLWETMPDAELFEWAANGQLGTPDEVEAQARRMLLDGRARPPLQRFFVEWLQVNGLGTSFRDPGVFPEFTPEVRSAMADQARRFFDHILWDRDASFGALYTTSELPVDGTLANLLELSTQPSGFEIVDVPHRAGILTLPALLTVQAVPRRSDPVRRGVLVRRKLLCQVLPDPPAGVDTDPPDGEPRTVREELALHAQDSCAGCHRLIDPVGLGFENYDAVGRYRTMYSDGSGVDSLGELVEAEVSGEFSGAVELASMLARSGEARDCFSKKWFEYAFGRPVASGDAPSIEQATAAMTDRNGSILELIIALVRSDAFLTGSEGGA